MKIIIINGAIASGKSTIGKLLTEKLSQQHPTSFLELDDEVKQFSLNFQWNSEKEKDSAWHNARKNLAIKTDKLLKKGDDVVVSGPFFLHDEISTFLDNVHEEGDVYLLR